VVYVLGNHEFYRHSLPELTEMLKRECEGSNIHVLEDSSVVLNGYRFLGCTLWTDFAVKGNPQAAMRVAEQMMSDYNLIRNSEERRNLRASDTAAIHRRSRKWLEGELSRGDNSKTIVVTHAAPSMRSEASYHRDSPIAPAFSSDMDELVEGSRVPLWVHGHTHYNVDYKIGGTRVLSNQRGYPEEVCDGFEAGMVVEV
jgi:Icc-related predicted phosphoesterase